MHFRTKHSQTLLLTAALLTLTSQGVAQAQVAPSSDGTPPLDYSNGNYTVEIYDADTIAKLNTDRREHVTAPVPTVTAPLTEQHAGLAQTKTMSISTTKPSVTSSDVMPVSQPKFPMDISAQYTDIDEGVPVIDNPKNCDQNGLDVDVRVENVYKTKGLIVADLHNDVKEDFLVWDKVVLRVVVPATKGAVNFCIPLKQPGDYAIVLYHDKDSDREFDKNFLGIPSEHFGMSQNPKFGLKSPKLEEAIFTVPEAGTAITIQLRKASDVL